MSSKDTIIYTHYNILQSILLKTAVVFNFKVTLVASMPTQDTLRCLYCFIITIELTIHVLNQITY